MEKIKLPKGFRNHWLKALRSDKFKQASGALVASHYEQNNIGYCCLGVACTFQFKGTFNDYHNAFNGYGFITGLPDESNYWSNYVRNGVHNFLTTEMSKYNVALLFEKLNLPSIEKYVFGSNTSIETILTHMNDDIKLSFEQIASVIEEITE